MDSLNVFDNTLRLSNLYLKQEHCSHLKWTWRKNFTV